MKRRGFLKYLAAMVALPFVAPLAALCKPKATRDAAYIECARPLFALTKNDDLFGPDNNLLTRTGQIDRSVLLGAKDHWRSGLTVLNTPNAELFKKARFSDEDTHKFNYEGFL